MNDDLAARRAAVLERVERRAAREQARQADEIDHIAAEIVRSQRRHPSSGRPYDREDEDG